MDDDAEYDTSIMLKVASNINLVLFCTAVAATELQLSYMQVVDRSEAASSFEASSDVDYGHQQFTNIQILDCNGEICQFEDANCDIYVNQSTDYEKYSKCYPGKGINPYGTVIENATTTN